MKVIMYVANRMHIIIAIYLVSLIVSSSLFAHFEGKTMWDGLWWSVVTALTIGYGDLAPATVPGRVTGIVFGHFWIFGIIPMIIGNIVTRLLEDRNKFTNEEQEWQEAVLKALAEKSGIKCPEAPPDY